jgi:hypothetical protein
MKTMAAPSGAAILLFGGCMILALGIASRTIAATNSVIWEKGDQLVELVAQDTRSMSLNDHPTNLSSGDIRAMLQRVKLSHAGDDSDQAIKVFTEDEIDNLSTAVANGLGRASSSQDVVFHVVGSHRIGNGFFAKRNRISAGRMFYLGGQLNIIFGQIQTPYRKKNIYGQLDQDFSPRNFGSRTTPVEHEVVLTTGDAVQTYRSNTGVRPDWIVIQTSDTATPAQAVVFEPAPTPTPLAVATSPPPVIAPQPVQPVTEPAPTDGIEARLQALKRLRDMQLISEDAYQTKMQEILQDL